MGPKTGFASDVLVTIYVWVGTLLAVVILQPATVIDQYLEVLWCHNSKLNLYRGRRGIQHPE